MNNQSVIKYTPSFKKAELIKVKLKTIDPVTNQKLEESCVVFDKGGIEALLYTIEDFRIAYDAIELDITSYLINRSKHFNPFTLTYLIQFIVISYRDCNTNQ